MTAPAPAVIVPATTAEVVGRPPTTVRLFADASATEGAVSLHEVRLDEGADGVLGCRRGGGGHTGLPGGCGRAGTWGAYGAERWADGPLNPSADLSEEAGQRRGSPNT